MDIEILRQLSAINQLLQSHEFARLLAEKQHLAYYASINQPAPPFANADDRQKIIQTDNSQRRIASRLTAFYALECSVGLFCSESDLLPSVLLQQLVSEQVDPAVMHLICRFANATWKAGQPFQSEDNIHKPEFVGANFLPPNYWRQQEEQILRAAAKLLSSLQQQGGDTFAQQMELIRQLLHNRDYAIEMADAIDSTPEDPAEAFTPITAMAQKVAINIAGFYAVESCCNYLVSITGQLPGDILAAIIEETLDPEDRELFCRFANATWKAGQPFRALDRIERKTFCPYYFLTAEDVQKDWLQVVSAAREMLAVID